MVEKVVPFPYFGGKRMVASVVWSRLGNVNLYIEPFFGGGAVLLLRPDSHQWWQKYEIVNDIDGLLCNFWRAVKYAPEEVAKYADWPVVENDLHARHIWLKEKRKIITERILGDPEYYDAKAAGWWLWGISLWIGTMWCFGSGPWKLGIDKDGYRVLVNVNNKPNDVQIIEEVEGIKKQKPRQGAMNIGIYNVSIISQRLDELLEYNINIADVWLEYITDVMKAISSRLRNVHVFCGDWKRVLPSKYIISKYKKVGIFLDPPYDKIQRYNGIYSYDECDIEEVREICIEYSNYDNVRIALCGYVGEHDILHERYGWSFYEWKNCGGYANTKRKRCEDERKLERIWFSPNCIGRSKQNFIDFEDEL